VKIGVLIQPQCRSCQTLNPPGSNFCFSCGNRLGLPGGFWVRLLAYLIDAVLMTALFLLVWPIVSGESIADYLASSEELTAGDLFSLGLNLVYYTGAVATWATTIGKRPFRLYVVRTDGSRVGVGRALARYLAYVPSAIILGAGFLMIAWRQDKRGLHDLICDTVVIRR